MKEYAACIAIDWADKKHDCCLRASGSDKLEQFVIKHSARDIETWVLALRKRFNGKQIAIVLEQSKGALVYALMKYDFIVLYPINPTTVAKYREAFSLSGAKDDPTDAKLILELFTKHYEKLKAWKPDTRETRMLQQLVEQRKVLVEDRKRLGNRLTSLLKGYYPQILEIFPKMGRLVLCEFVIKYPTLKLAQRASDQELLEFFRTHRSGHSKIFG